jgi:hypothetical protein
MGGTVSGVYHRWTIQVTGSTAYVSLDGRGYGTINLGHGNEIVVRVWNAAVILNNVVISRAGP